MAATIDDTGYFPETQGERKAELDQEMSEAFPQEGNEVLDLTPDSYTGRSNGIMAEQLVSSENLAASFIDILDPQQSTGVWTDYHLRLQSTQRKKATFSQISARLEGTPGTLVGDKRTRYTPNDSLWRTPILGTDGNPLVLPANGILLTTLTATVAGPVDAVETGTTSWVIVDEVVGWSNASGSAESTARASLGTEVESDFEARQRLARTETSALGVATEPACTKALFEIDGVTDAEINNNRKLFPQNGVPAKSIEAIVEGGDPQEICDTILSVYPGSSGFFGNVTCTATVSFTQLDGTVKTISKPVKYTVPELIPIIASYAISYGRPEFAPDDLGVALAVAAAEEYINTAGRDVDVIPDASGSAVLVALPSASEPVVTAQVAVRGTPLAAATIPISIRQRGFTNPQPQAAIVTGTQVETFNMPLASPLILSINGSAPIIIVFSPTDFAIISAALASEVVAAIGRQTTAVTAGVDDGAVQLVSLTAGAGSQIEILGTSDPALLAVLGFVVGTTTGSDGDIVIVFI